MRTNPGVEVTTINASLDEVTTMVAGGSGPDLIWVGQSWGSQIPYLSSLNQFLDRNPDLKDSLVPGMTEGFTFEGETYAIPFSASTGAVAYNADLLAAAGLTPPDASWTWDDALPMARKITKDENGDGLPETWGMSIDWQPWGFLSYGEGIYTNNGRDANLDNDIALEAMQIFQDLWSGNTLVMPSGYVGESTPPEEVFAAGRLGFWEIGIFSLPQLRSTSSFAWDVVEFPQLEFQNRLYKGDSWSGEGYALLNTSAHPEEALAFAKFMMSEDQIVPLAQKGSIMPASLSVLRDVYLAAEPPPANMEAFINALDTAGAPWAHPAFGRVMEYMFHPIFNTDPPHDGSEPMANILARAQEALQRALDEFYATQ